MVFLRFVLESIILFFLMIYVFVLFALLEGEADLDGDFFIPLLVINLLVLVFWNAVRVRSARIQVVERPGNIRVALVMKWLTAFAITGSIPMMFFYAADQDAPSWSGYLSYIFFFLVCAFIVQFRKWK